MTAIVESIEIARRPGDVFAYATDLSRYPEWQRGVGSARLQGDGPITAGSRAVMTRTSEPFGHQRLPANGWSSYWSQAGATGRNRLQLRRPPKRLSHHDARPHEPRRPVRARSAKAPLSDGA
jgi:hypothetical protein